MLQGHLLFALALAVAPLAALAQAAAPQTAPGYTLSVNTRLVIEDVTVTDSAGKPVTRLPRSAFHVRDDGAVRLILELREQTAALSPPSAPATPDIHTNASLLHNQGTIVAVLIDPAAIDLQDQMYLRVQALRFVDLASPGTRIAVFRANARGVPILLQPPTADHQLLRAAISLAIPVMGRPVDSTFANAITELANLSAYLRPVPGRKAVLWLAGRFPLYKAPDFTLTATDDQGRDEDTRAAYRDLEQARISVYPIDVRGVLMGGLAPVRVIDTQAAANDPGSIPKTPVSESAKAAGQYDSMDQIADATGGRAFYSNNAVASVMQSAVELATSSYTLSYQPTDGVPDGKWHHVVITVDGPFRVRYRTGYFSAGTASRNPPEQRRPLDRQGHAAIPETTSSATPATSQAAEDTEPQLIFSARVLSSATQGRSSVVRIRYVIPTAQLQFTTAAETGHARLRLAALSYNAWGDVLSHVMDVIDTHYTPQQMQLAARIGTPADQTVEIPKDAQFLLLAVEDLRTHEVGTLQIPVSTLAAEASKTP